MRVLMDIDIQVFFYYSSPSSSINSNKSKTSRHGFPCKNSSIYGLRYKYFHSTALIQPWRFSSLSEYNAGSSCSSVFKHYSYT